MKRLIVANWKMNLTAKQADILVDRLRVHITKPTAQIVLCPAFVFLPAVSEKLRKLDPKLWHCGAQNINEHDEGPLTGEISAPMIGSYGAYCIIGHSERRINFFETDEKIALKMAAAIRGKIKPILCVGENLHQRNEGLAGRTVLDQLQEDLSELTPKEVAKISIAYEPVWAIGSGQNASPHDVEQMFDKIYSYLIGKYGADIAAKVRLLYGGSVNGNNARTYLETRPCSGLLIGTASLNYKEFSKICQL